jgi:hypothetical protein
MLLTKPHGRYRSAGDEHSGHLLEHEDERPDGASWILVGGLDRALLQAGIIGRLLEAGQRPATIISSGFALANAVLVAGTRREPFDRSWEQLRAGRFLVSAALGSVRLLGALNGMYDDLVSVLAEVVQGRRSRADAEPEILVATEDGFAELGRDSTSTSWRAALKRSLRYTSESAPLVAGAIREAALRGGPILVLGLERTMQSHPDIDAACRGAAAEGTPVAFLMATAAHRSALLDYILPGSGVPERLMNLGRAAADQWMGNARRNGSSRSGQAPFGGLGGSDGKAFSEPDDDDLCDSDASDSSN